jgi:uncharacterized coiled-coil protein SlyX
MFQEISRTKNQAVTFALPIAKVDASTRTVKGIASQEIEDAHGQIVDYATLKACLPAYKHNIREMHQPKAVGKAVAIECDDANQAVIVESYISKGAEDTWTKVEEGILTSYSIGGVGDIVIGKNAAGKTEQRIFLSALHEISLVDVPACPTATFEIVKLVDGAPTDVRPADPDEVKKFASNVQRAIKALSKAIARHERHMAGTEATDEASQQRMMDEMRAALAALDDGTDTEKMAAAITLADTAVVTKAVEVKKRLWEGYDIERALAVLALIQGLITSEIDDVIWGDPVADGDAEGAAQLDTLRLAAQLIFDFLASEFDSQFTALEARQAAIGKLAAGPAAEAIRKVLGGSGVAKVLRAIDKGLAQKMHDNSVHLGAACKDIPMKSATETPATEKPAETPAAPVVEKAADAPAADPAAPIVGEQIDIAGIVKSAVAEANAPLVKQLEEQQATLSANAETIATLEKRLKTVEDSPAPGGPVRTVPGPDGGVTKTLAGEQTAQPTAEDAQRTLQLAAELAPDMTPEQRAEAVKKVLAATFALGGTPIAR